MQTANETSDLSRKADTPNATEDNVADTLSTSDRRVLGEVSPNVKITSSTPSFMKRAVAGSPLKRSFTAAMEGGGGFQYLKRRKLDENQTLSDIVGGSLHDSREDIDAVEDVWLAAHRQSHNATLTLKRKRRSRSLRKQHQPSPTRLPRKTKTALTRLPNANRSHL